MSEGALFVTFILMGLITFGLRFSLILLSQRWSLPELVRRGLGYIPPAVLSAIVFPEIFRPEGKINLSPANPYLVAGVAAVITAWFTKNVFATMVVGMLILWFLLP